MCVICHAAKKRYMKRAEVVQAMKANNAGFFGFTVHDGARRTIRTLDDKEFLKFFDECVGDDDVWVMHARIPSRGEKTVANVHGWEQDGILFCHNMTLSQLDDMMKNAKWEGTDSEFFFRHIFIPFYKGCGGPEACKDGKFCPDLDNLVRHFCGYQNKFLFIMPDDTVVRYGNWVEEKDRKTDDGQVAFHASNGSYKVYKPRWPQTSTGFDARDGYYYGGGYYSHFNDGDWADYDDDVPSPGSARSSPPSVTDELKRKKELVELVRKTCGDVQLCRFALCDVVAHGAAAYRGLPGDWAPDGEDDDVSDYMYELMPDCFDNNTYDAAVRGFESLADAEPGGSPEYTPADYAADYAAEFAENLVKAGAKQANGTGIVPLYPTARHVEAGLKLLSRQWRVFTRIAGVAVDFSAKGAASFACVAESPERDGNRWKTNKVRTEDILVDETESPETTYKAVGRLLDFIRMETAREQERSLG